MPFTRHAAAAALLAAMLATGCGLAAMPAIAGSLAAPDASGLAADAAPDHGPGSGARDDFGPPGPGAPGPGMPFGQLHGLDLSEAQQDQLFAIMHAQAPQRREQDKAIRKAARALRELGRAERFDDARAVVLARELGQALGAEALLRARTAAQVDAVLTPQQREQQRQHRQHRQPGPGRGAGAGREEGPQAPGQDARGHE